MKAGIAGAVALVGVLVSGGAMADGSQLLVVCPQAIKAAGDPQTISSQVTTIVSVVGGVVGLTALTVAWSQMKIASAKVRLDLYNKRFNIFLATVEYYFASYGKTDGDMREKSRDFVKGCREAKFLFDKKDGIYDTLMRIMDHGSRIQAYEDAASGATPNVCNDARRIMHESSVNARSAFDKDLHTLEDQLTKYITFKTVTGWRG